MIFDSLILILIVVFEKNLFFFAFLQGLESFAKTSGALTGRQDSYVLGSVLPMQSSVFGLGSDSHFGKRDSFQTIEGTFFAKVILVVVQCFGYVFMVRDFFFGFCFMNFKFFSFFFSSPLSIELFFAFENEKRSVIVGNF